MINIRAYRNGDEEKILELDERVLPSKWNPRSLSNWKWKFTETNPAGRASVQVAEKEGSLIAHFAAVPIPVRIFDRDVTGSHTIGALVDERYQNKGLLKLVADKLWQDLVCRNIPLTWGFPNQRAYSLHKHFLGYRDLIEFPTWKRIMPGPRVNSTPEGFQPVKSFTEEFDRLWDDCSFGRKIMVVRNSSHLNWRYARRPDHPYHSFGSYHEGELRGYIILKLYREGDLLRGHIIDLLAREEDEEAHRTLIRGGLEFFKHHKVNETTTWIWGSPMIEQLLAADNFIPVKDGRILMLRANQPLTFDERAFDPQNWYFTMGDSTEIF